MDNGVAKVIGGIYIALTGAIGPDAARVAHEKLARFALSPDLPAEDRRVYACITHCASQTAEEAAAELEQEPERRSKFEWIDAVIQPAHAA